MHKLINRAIREAIEEVVGKRFDAMERRFDAIDRRFDTVDSRFDAAGKRIDALGARLDSRIDGSADRFSAKFDELSAQQGRMIEHIAGLKGAVASLETDRKVMDTLEHRVARIEDRLFAKTA